MKMPLKIFVTGTDTGVGKTLVSALLVAGLNYEYYKPVQSGLAEGTDTDWVRRHTGVPDDYFHRETYRLTRPLSPHAAAEKDGVTIDPEAFRLPETRGARGLVVEGAGGVMVPLNGRYLMVDLMKKLNLPVLLVARSTLGTINHTLLSIDKLRQQGLDPAGVVLNGPPDRENRKAIEHFGRIEVLAEIEPLSRIDPRTLKHVFQQVFNR